MNKKIRRLLTVIGIESLFLLVLVVAWVITKQDTKVPSESNATATITITPEASFAEIETDDTGQNELEEGTITKENLESKEIEGTSNNTEDTSDSELSSNGEMDAVVSDTAEESEVIGEETSTADSESSSNDIQNSEGFDEAYIATLSTAQAGTLLSGSGTRDIVYYMQTDERWADLYYGGTDTIEKYACGPTSMAMVVSTLTDISIDPVQMSAWANQNNYWYPESGSLHSLIPDCAKAFGLQSLGVENTPEAGEKLAAALKEGKLVVALMGKGQFTNTGHFIVLRGITEDGKVLVGDANSKENTDKEWDMDTIVGEAKVWANANGPFWIIWK